MKIFDARSARMGRMTGWERYTTMLSSELGGQDVSIWAPRVRPLPYRFLSDVKARRLPKDALVHFPTFPPALPDYKRLVLTVHDLSWWRYPETASMAGRHWYRRLMEVAIRRADAIVTPSRTVADEVSDHFKIHSSRILPIHCGVSFVPGTAEPERSTICPQRPYLLAVGSVEPRKNLHRMIRAFQISGVREDYDLIVVGRQAWGEKLRGVRVLTDVNDSQLQSLYRGAAALVMPSLYEGFGLPIVEAMVLGTPVICSDIPVFREVAGATARYFNPLDIEDQARALASVGSTDRVPDEMVAELKRSFNWSHAGRKLLALYDQLL